MFRLSSAVVKAVHNVPASRSFATYKTSTGLVGLAVDPNGRETLLALSKQLMEAVKPIPADSMYRINVEKWFTYIPKVVNKTKNIKQIEDEIAIGQIEEIIAMAKDELELVDYYIENKGWELIAQAEAEAEHIVKAQADSIFFTNPLPPPPPPAAPEVAAPAAPPKKP